MTDSERRAAARQFVTNWTGRGDEKQETQAFWMDLLQSVYGVQNPAQFISFELPVKLSHTSFIDGYIDETRVLIEQKGAAIDLDRGQKQSDGAMLTPFQQARRYAGYLPHDKNPRWIVVCNFQEFRIHDMNRPNDPPEILLLSDLEKESHRLNFLTDTGDENIRKEMEVSLQAGEIVGVLYDALLKRYKNPDSPETLKSLNALCVRLVFCLYAEDAGIFGGKNKFHDYLNAHRAEDRLALIRLFQVLDQKPEERDPYLDDDLASFPYVNGGLFANESIEIPRLGDEIIDLILQRASADFDWSVISPTIFGAVFESTLNPETRRSGGMHYTSIENIHKVIDPLFLDGLKAELEEIKAIAVDRTRNAKLRNFQRKLASLKFLDPACGSGNFLTESFLSLRRLENEAISLLYWNQIVMETKDPIQVSISQFYGIEINDFAVTVARTALWIAESQMMKETENVVHLALDFLPLKTSANIVEGNALRIDWESVVPKYELNYIMGNPPFVGFKFAGKSQKDDMQVVFGKFIKPALLDYVCCWYAKAAEYVQGTNCKVAFVSTNSVSQGQMVGDLWTFLLSRYPITINFAWRSFVWDSESKKTAHVHVVVIGFSCVSLPGKKLFSGNAVSVVSHISPYLIEGEDVLITSRKKPICNVPIITMGNQAMDGGNLIIEESDYEEFIQNEPSAIPFIKRYMMGYEFINNKKRWCLWLVGCSPAQLRAMPLVMRRVKAVQEMRASSNDLGARKKSETPMLFREQRNPSEYIAIPITSSQQRKYIPMGYLNGDTIPGNTLFIIEKASIYHFGILISNVHMAWMKTVGARMKSDYRYSKDIVYNNFPWPNPTDAQRAQIEQTAQMILDARALYPDASLADLYDETVMPPELRKAHQANDRAVMGAYGFTKDHPAWKNESACVAELMKLYQKLT